MNSFGIKRGSSLRPHLYTCPLQLGFLVFFVCCSMVARAEKGSAPIYEDPFDIGAGGASLTKASQVGVLFSNPALLRYGAKFHRWFGFESYFFANKESIDTARDILNASKDGGNAPESQSDSESGATSQSSSDTAQFVDKVFKNPLYFGWGSSLAWINSFGGLAVFSRFAPDIRAREFGTYGSPQLSFRAESYHGVAATGALSTPFRWLSLGVTAKYLYAAEPDLSIEVTDQEKIKSLSDPGFVRDLADHHTAVGGDVGALVFLQGDVLDYRLALKVDDFGNTKFSGGADATGPREFKQVASVGTSLTFHTGADALHLALDYRDIQQSYGEPLFKRVRAGTKLTLRQYVGLAAGLYDGYPSYAVEIDLILLRLSATAYTRELGRAPGVDPRNIYMVSLCTGF